MPTFEVLTERLLQEKTCLAIRSGVATSSKDEVLAIRAFPKGPRAPQYPRGLSSNLNFNTRPYDFGS